MGRMRLSDMAAVELQTAAAAGGGEMRSKNAGVAAERYACALRSAEAADDALDDQEIQDTQRARRHIGSMF